MGSCNQSCWNSVSMKAVLFLAFVAAACADVEHGSKSSFEVPDGFYEDLQTALLETESQTQEGGDFEFKCETTCQLEEVWNDGWRQRASNGWQPQHELCRRYGSFHSFLRWNAWHANACCTACSTSGRWRWQRQGVLPPLPEP